MFIVIGVLSILVGLFVFSQANTLLRLSMLTDAHYDISGTFLLVSFAFIFAGAMMIASKDGQKTKLLSASLYSYIILFILAVINFQMGDMAIWTFVSGGMIAFLIIWGIRHSDPNKKLPKEETYIDPDMVEKDNESDRL